MPEGDTVVIRWLGTSNYEVAYKDKVILMDTFYERPGRTRPIGIDVADVKRADAILIGHAHFDHISDVAPVAAQTGAPVIGSEISATAARDLGVPAQQVRSVAGGELMQFGDIGITPTHILHSTIQPELIPALRDLYTADSLGPLTADEAAQAAQVSARGSRDPAVGTQGTMGYTLSFPSGFKIVWFDSVGDISDGERALAASLGPGVDVGMFPYTPHAIAERQLAYTWPHLQLFQPKIFLPTHHDHIWNTWLDNGLQPLFMKIRDEQPQTQFMAPLYLSPICISTSGATRGQYNIKY